jgi:flagellar biosynthesis protein FliR
MSDSAVSRFLGGSPLAVLFRLFLVSVIVGAFLMLLGTTLIFATNTHHLFIAGLVGSYELISPVAPLVTGDFVELAIRTLGDAFMLGVQLSAPLFTVRVYALL